MTASLPLHGTHTLIEFDMTAPTSNFSTAVAVEIR